MGRETGRANRGGHIMKTRLTFLGTGTSQGIPIIGCKCPVCRSNDLKNKRFRSAAFVEYGGLSILVDAGPDFRMQMLAHDISHLDAILLTHDHRDHTGGLDDVRSLNYIDQRAAEIYCEQPVLESLKKSFAYVFEENKYPGAPEWNIHLIDERPFFVEPGDEDRKLIWVHDRGYCWQTTDGELIPTNDRKAAPAETADDSSFKGGLVSSTGRGVEIIPIRGMHDKMPVLGFRFGDIAYITDMSLLPDRELKKLQGLEHVTLNTVGYKPHHSHFSLYQAIDVARKIGAKHTWLTHLSHNFPVYMDFAAQLRELAPDMDIQPAYDGLIIEA